MELFSGKTLILKEMTIRLAKEMEAITEARTLKEKCGNGTDETNYEEEETFLGNITLSIDD